MKKYLQAGLLMTLIAAIAAMLFWSSLSGPERGIQDVQTGTVHSASALAIVEKRAETPNVAPPNVSEPAPAAKAILLTTEERQHILAEFVKAADKDIAKVQKSIEEARQLGAPAEQIAAQEDKLKMMQQFKQDTLARNAS